MTSLVSWKLRSRSTDGTVSVELAVSFVDPVKTTSAGNGVPLVGLNAQIQTTGGTLVGGQNLYYGVTAVDSSAPKPLCRLWSKLPFRPVPAPTQSVCRRSVFHPRPPHSMYIAGPLRDSCCKSRRTCRSHPRIPTRVQPQPRLVRRIRTTITRISTGGWSCSRRSRLTFSPP